MGVGNFKVETHRVAKENGRINEVYGDDIGGTEQYL